MVTDPIGDFLIRIKNAGMRGHECVTAPYSKIKHNIADVLVAEGYAKDIVKKGKKIKKNIELGLIYSDSKPKINDVKRISLPSRRVYKNAKDLAQMNRGRGIIIVSTPKGVITAKEAVKRKVGGEVLCSIQ